MSSYFTCSCSQASKPESRSHHPSCRLGRYQRLVREQHLLLDQPRTSRRQLAAIDKAIDALLDAESLDAHPLRPQPLTVTDHEVAQTLDSADPVLARATNDLTAQLLADGWVGRANPHEYPPWEEGAEFLVRAAELLYPGVGRHKELTAANLTEHVGGQVDALYLRLKGLVERSYRSDHARGATHPNLAAKTARGFISRLASIREVLATDIEAAYKGDPAAKSRTEIILSYPGFWAVLVYRLAHELHRLEVPLLPRMLAEMAHSKDGIDIHPEAVIGPGFFIDHGTGVVIGQTCEIGAGVRLYQGVTLGALSLPRDANGAILHNNDKRHPTLRDGVVVYANATILGGRTVVGERSVIGANVWLTESVPPDAKVYNDRPKF